MLFLPVWWLETVARSDALAASISLLQTYRSPSPQIRFAAGSFEERQRHGGRGSKQDLGYQTRRVRDESVGFEFNGFNWACLEENIR